MDITDILNMEKYPDHQPDSAQGRALIASIKASLREDGSCTLEDFVTTSALDKMTAQAHSLVDAAFPGPKEVSPYFFNYAIGEGMDVDDSHPTRHRGKRNLSQVAADLIPEEFLLKKLYRSPLMTEFLGPYFPMNPKKAPSPPTTVL